jgi:hypothetical protein
MFFLNGHVYLVILIDVEYDFKKTSSSTTTTTPPK